MTEKVFNNILNINKRIFSLYQECISMDIDSEKFMNLDDFPFDDIFSLAGQESDIYESINIENISHSSIDSLRKDNWKTSKIIPEYSQITSSDTCDDIIRLRSYNILSISKLDCGDDLCNSYIADNFKPFCAGKYNINKFFIQDAGYPKLYIMEEFKKIFFTILSMHVDVNRESCSDITEDLARLKYFYLFSDPTLENEFLTNFFPYGDVVNIENEEIYSATNMAVDCVMSLNELFAFEQATSSIDNLFQADITNHYSLDNVLDLIHLEASLTLSRDTKTLESIYNYSRDKFNENNGNNFVKMDILGVLQSDKSFDGLFNYTYKKKK